MNYQDFLEAKDIVDKRTGFEPSGISPMLYPFQSAIVQWACRRGRAAIFADCGLGKTPMQLEWARQVYIHTGKPVLILAPLAVSKQTKREGDKFGIIIKICESQEDVSTGINITNYEKLHKFDPSVFSGVVLDESSILKSYTGKFRTTIIDSFARTPYKLACTATPAPNDFIELGNHSEFLNVLSRPEMLSLFFVNDTSDIGTWRLKGHGQEKFWKWLCSWAVMLTKPSELGFDDNGFILPELNIIHHSIPFGKPLPGSLFIQKAETLDERRTARRESIEEKLKKVLDLTCNYGIIDHPQKEDDQCLNGNPSTEKTGEGERRKIQNTEKDARTTPGSEPPRKTGSICENITQKINRDGPEDQRNNEINITPKEGNGINPTNNTEKIKNEWQGIEQQNNAAHNSCQNTDSQIEITKGCCTNKTESALFAGRKEETKQENAFTSITATQRGLSEDCCARTAITCSEKLKTTPNCSRKLLLIWVDLNREQDALENLFGNDSFSVRGSQSDEEKERNIWGWINGERPVMISKPSIMGWGLNLQSCHNVIFFGLSDSYEAFYQAIRRCWRFGQKHPVNCHIITTDIEGNVVDNIQRKEADAMRMRMEMVKNMQDISASEIRECSHTESTYESDVFNGDGYELHLGDSVEKIKDIPADSIGFSIFSPPFASLFTYTNSIRDMGNCRDKEIFFQHFQYFVDELYRVLMPGRLVAIHCMNLTATITHDGFIGLHDFRGDIIRLFLSKRFIFHSEICIWKDPLIQAVRTKALPLAHKQICKDSSRCAMGIPDYIVVMRKPGENPKPISHPKGLTVYIGGNDFTNTNVQEDQRKNKQSHEIWQRYASPVWTDIRQTRVLSTEIARDEKDEKHVCPLQLDTIERCLELWSAPGDIVLDPFSGIGSVVYSAVNMGRYGIGIELKQSYWKQSIKNLQSLDADKKQAALL